MKKIKNHIKAYKYTNRMLEEADVEIKIIEKHIAFIVKKMYDVWMNDKTHTRIIDVKIGFNDRK